MQLSILVPLIALFVATTAYAYDPDREQACSNQASQKCPNTNKEPSDETYGIRYYRCRATYWRSLPSDGNCRYKKIGCHCIQGCMQDFKDDQKPDLEGYCVNGCDWANKTPEPCT
ncbi:hypothetical protein V8E36_006808 [Tilletia maclaganii]